LKNKIINDEIDFVENHIFDPINITKEMTDREFNELFIDIIDARHRYSKYQMPVKRRRKSGAYETHVKCPYCNEMSIYGNYIPPGFKSYHINDICCRNCRIRFHIVSLPFNIFIRLFMVTPSKLQPFIYAMMPFMKSLIRKVISLLTKSHG